MSENDIQKRLGRIGVKIAFALIVFGFVWVARPLFHGILYGIAYSPGVLYVVGIPTAIGVLLYFAPPFGDDLGESLSSKSTYVGTAFVIMLVVGGGLAVAGSSFEEKTLAQETMDGAESIDELPKINAENPRIVPKAVADVQTSGSISYRQHQLGSSDIARAEDGSLTWSYPIEPDQFRNQFSNNQRGILLSDMTSMEDREISAYDEQRFKYGENMFLDRSADWNLKKTDYWVQYRDDAVDFTNDGKAYMAYPKTGHEWHLLPVPHTTPTWEGVALVHQNGTIDHLSPDEARDSEILDGQRIYPLYNSERKAASLDHRNGIINQLPLVGSFIGVVVPADIPSNAGNSQPFVVDMEGQNMNYVYAMEPAGQTSRGLDEVWFFNAQTGDTEYFRTSNETLFGPERAMGIVRSEDSRTGWARGSEGGNFRVVEPIATFIDGELWWHTKIVPIDNTDISRNAFVNAETGDVVELSETEEIIKFMSGEDVDTTEQSDAEIQDRGSQTYIVITNENGDVVDRIPIDQNQNVGIEFGESNATSEG